MQSQADKLLALKNRFSQMPSCVIAFSGGVDSTLLLASAHDALGKNALALTIRASVFPKSETDGAIRFCQERAIRHEIIDFDPLELSEFCANPPNRCYYCKKAIFARICNFAQKNSIPFVAEGSNLDDDKDFRPGRKALEEFGVISPLREAQFRKSDVRGSLKLLGIDSWRKPSAACLASRIPYCERITREKLYRIGEAESYIRQFIKAEAPLRVRLHNNDIARIEVNEESYPAIISRRIEISARLKALGLRYISLDLEEFKSGRMNDVL